MEKVQLRFYEELNDFLASDKRRQSFFHEFYPRTSIKDIIEALGVPHTEVELILANGESVDFSYFVKDGDRVSVYPMFESLDITPILKLRPRPLRRCRFVVDSHLGKLARYLRLLGFDTLYRNDYDDEELARISHTEHRILLTRDRGLLKRRMVTHGCFVRETDPRKQLHWIVSRLDLYHLAQPFKRCLRCNGLVRPVDKKYITHRLASKILDRHDEFKMCEGCEQIYWKGSHFKRMISLLQEVIRQCFNNSPE